MEVLLRYRQGRERQQELLLLEANHQVLQVRHQIEGVNAGLANAAMHAERQLGSGWTAAELQFEMLCRSVLVERRHQLEKELARRNEARSKCLEAAIQARRQREVIETLRAHQFQLYRQEEGRREQRRLDDLFLMRRNWRS